ncbi:MAG TPA: Ig-like domain-containing protein [Thermoplasmata archaeon]|nr:Ig-like domain-containing protein [Thermoplasmata archaeon]
MDKTATEGAISSNPAVTGAFAWSAGDTKVTWTPGAPLTASTLYTVTISTAAKSAAGVALPAPHVFSFTTASGAVPPSVSFTVPPDGEPNFPVNADIQITFSIAMDKTATQGAISAVPAIAGAFTWSVGDTKLTWNPGSDLQSSVDYLVNISTAAKSAAGTPLAAPYTFSFRTAAGPGPTPPTVSSTTPADGETNVPLNANVTMKFSEAMDEIATKGAFSISPNVPGTITWDRAARAGITMVFLPSQPFAASTKYTVTISTAAKSLAGANMATAKVFSFTTGTTSDTTPPAIIHTPVGSTVESTAVEIRATVTDAGGISSVLLLYKTSGSTSTLSVPMAPGAANEYKATIPAPDVKPDKVEYYIEARDKAGNLARDPATAPGTPHSFTVTKKDGGGGGPGAGGIFGMGAMMDAVIIGIVAAVAIGAIAGAVMMKRKKKQAPPAQAQGMFPPQGGYGGGQQNQQWGQQEQQWQQPPQGGQGWG